MQDREAPERSCPLECQGEVDFFGVYCSETGGVYLVPIAELPVRRQGTLRVEPAKNCQRKFIRPGSEYEIGRVKVHAPDSVSD